MIFFYIALGIIVVLVIAVIGIYNSLVRGRNLVKEAFSTMDVFMKKRYDLIPNLVETVKGYASHEK
ncbi:MAG: LemA family protein, partial [Erysipelothrix sp.]|nr:LemA family protein [Erysipelothrix sp.]